MVPVWKREGGKPIGLVRRLIPDKAVGRDGIPGRPGRGGKVSGPLGEFRPVGEVFVRFWDTFSTLTEALSPAA